MSEATSLESRVQALRERAQRRDEEMWERERRQDRLKDVAVTGARRFAEKLVQLGLGDLPARSSRAHSRHVQGRTRVQVDPECDRCVMVVIGPAEQEHMVAGVCFEARSDETLIATRMDGFEVLLTWEGALSYVVGAVEEAFDGEA